MQNKARRVIGASDGYNRVTNSKRRDPLVADDRLFVQRRRQTPTIFVILNQLTHLSDLFIVKQLHSHFAQFETRVCFNKTKDIIAYTFGAKTAPRDVQLVRGGASCVHIKY